MGGNVMDRRLVIIGLLGVFIFAPVAAWGSVVLYKTLTLDSSTTQSERSKDDLYRAIERSNKDLYGENVSRPKLEIVSFKRIEKQWYIATVKQNSGGDKTEKMLIGDFYPQADKMVVISEPGEGLVQFNISGIGVPYEVIDELNSQTGDS